MARTDPPHDALPPAIAEAARASDLGARQNSYRSGVHRINIWGAGTLTLVGLLTLAFGLFRVHALLAEGDDWYFAAPLLVLALLTFLIAAWMVISPSRKPVEWCVLHEHGLAYRRGREPVIAGRWTDVEQLVRQDLEVEHNGFTLGYNRMMMVIMPHGSAILTNTFPDADELCDRVAEAYTRAKLPRVVAMLKEGRTVPFGKLAVDLDGVHHEDDVLPWAQIRDIKVNGQVAQLFVEGRRKAAVTVLCLELPDQAVFLRLANKLRGRAGRSAR